MTLSTLISLLVYAVILQVSSADQLAVLTSPKAVQLADVKQATLADMSALPYHLFGIDESQSALVADVPFLHRPRVLALMTVACAACPLIPASAGGRRIALGSDASDLLLFGSGGLRRQLRRRRLLGSVVAHTADLSDSTRPDLFDGIADADSLPALDGEAALPAGEAALISELRRAQEAVRRLADSKLLADSQPDVLHIEINSLAGRQRVPDSVQKFVAKQLASLAKQLQAAAGGGAFVVAATVADGAPLIRLGRSLLAAPEAAAGGGMNLAADYDADFPVMFNLILWLSVVLALAVYAIGYSLWNIDPGRDSIIYRRGYSHAKMD